ncbi:Glucokinase [Arthrobacter sp. Bi83]|uniref:ROK family protein n=1 Tax=Arthrobacter sp. Bi83 TaxID=2822353 RepID=UPI001DF63C8C|nr:ROK family protein [Arthrobacter sp. Bi83]CAH0278147.1 Glucokinase [Arthrobacter sp. Bi83]
MMAESGQYLGIDVGGTRIKWSVVEDAKIVATGDVPTPREGGEILISLLKNLTASLGPTTRAIGLALPGLVNTQTRSTIFIPNIPGSWMNYPIAAEIEKSSGVPVFILNDARAFGHAELIVGAGRGERNALFLTLGTGVGGAIARDGQILVGEIDSIGEMGHVNIDAAGEICGCGGVGCLETVASGSALVGHMARVALTSLSPALASVLGDSGLQALTPESISRAADMKDPWALAAFEKIGRHLGLAAGTACVLMQLSCVVVGGGMSGAFRHIAPSMKAALEERTSVTGAISLHPAQLGSESGSLGAALYAGIRTEQQASQLSSQELAH